MRNELQKFHSQLKEMTDNKGGDILKIVNKPTPEKEEGFEKMMRI